MGTSFSSVWGLFQSSDEFEVLMEDGEKFLFSAHYGGHMETGVWNAACPETLGETLGTSF